MSRWGSCLLLTLVAPASCVAPRAEEPRSAPKPASTGATLFVLDAWQDFLDDGGKVYDPTEGFPQWFGEQALAIILRSVERNEDIRLLGTVRADLRVGELNTFRVAEPLHYFARRRDGSYVLRKSSVKGSLKLVVTPVPADDRDHVTVEYAVIRGAPDREAIAGTELEAGKPYGMREEVVEEGVQTIPLRGTLFWFHRRENGRGYVLLFHIAGVSPSHAKVERPPLPDWVGIGWCNVETFRKSVEPLLREKGIPSFVPGPPYWLSAPVYTPRAGALEARRVIEAVTGKKPGRTWPAAFEPLGNEWIYVGAVQAADLESIIRPLLRSNGIELKNEGFTQGETWFHVRASHFEEATRLVTAEMKAKNRPFIPAAKVKPMGLIDIDRY